MNQEETWHGGSPRPCDIVLDGDPAPPPQKKGGTAHPLFSAHVCCGWTVIDGWMPLGTEVGWICDARVWTTHERQQVVFITVQNLVGIDTVVSIICKF